MQILKQLRLKFSTLHNDNNDDNNNKYHKYPKEWSVHLLYFLQTIREDNWVATWYKK